MATQSAPFDERAPQPDRVVTPAVRRRLQECYERGVHLTRKRPCDHDYAHTVFSECVVRDPGNVVYIDAMLENLRKKFDDNRKGSRFRAFVSRGPLKKAVKEQDWVGVLRRGPDLLRFNPWDVTTLRALAHACEHYHFYEAGLRYLRSALDANSKDAEVNRHCAISLARIGQFDQAISCWHRVEEARPDDPEPRQRISQLTVEKSRGAAGFSDASNRVSRPDTPSTEANSSARPARDAEDAASSRAVGPENDGGKSDAQAELSEADPSDPSWAGAGDRPVASDATDRAQRGIPLTRSQQLEQDIRQYPEDAENYVQLARLYLEEGRFAEAERTVRRGAAVSSDPRLQEINEQCGVARARHQLAVAERRAELEGTDEARQLVEQIRGNLCRIELEVYDRRSQRYPGSPRLKLELAIRLKRLGNYDEAIRQLEAARQQQPESAASTLELGECQQHKRQYAQALYHYQQAADEARRQGAHRLRHLALYRAGVLAAGLKEWNTATRYLETLAGEAPDFKDVQPRLDKVRQMQDKD